MLALYSDNWELMDEMVFEVIHIYIYYIYDDPKVEVDALTGEKLTKLKALKIYANSHYVTPRPTINQAIKSIKIELKNHLNLINF